MSRYLSIFWGFPRSSHDSCRVFRLICVTWLSGIVRRLIYPGLVVASRGHYTNRWFGQRGTVNSTGQYRFASRNTLVVRADAVIHACHAIYTRFVDGHVRVVRTLSSEVWAMNDVKQYTFSWRIDKLFGMTACPRVVIIANDGRGRGQIAESCNEWPINANFPADFVLSMIMDSAAMLVKLIDPRGRE